MGERISGPKGKGKHTLQKRFWWQRQGQGRKEKWKTGRRSKRSRRRSSWRSDETGASSRDGREPKHELKEVNYVCGGLATSAYLALWLRRIAQDVESPSLCAGPKCVASPLRGAFVCRVSVFRQASWRAERVYCIYSMVCDCVHQLTHHCEPQRCLYLY
ncbi:hypothetical protein PUMCH_001686 [Australozyma saopauloensis]|uniref:Uncharacterized protein n=1 Tax=Australozyma saopauloensis TaxID=291208 RepID=A0AAX4H780_9ASCO|nr:hypothetical protein PUMCH_001686 [[Candida] saopauloensis]